MDLGQHAVFIVSSYAVVAAALTLLAVWLTIDGRRQQRALQQLEARGVRRRSDASGGTVA